MDSKDKNDITISKDAPKISEYRSDESNKQFSELTQKLKDSKIPYLENPHLVRGLDYYNRTIFEFISNEIGSQNAICGGGRYDSLVSQLGGNDTPSIGFAAGMERILLAISKEERVMRRVRGLWVSNGNRSCHVIYKNVF